MKSSIFWDITPCSLLKVNRRFGGTCRHHLQVRRIGRTRNQRESRWQAHAQQTIRCYNPEYRTLQEKQFKKNDRPLVSFYPPLSLNRLITFELTDDSTKLHINNVFSRLPHFRTFPFFVIDNSNLKTVQTLEMGIKNVKLDDSDTNLYYYNL
jgi:hypothetical protein